MAQYSSIRLRLPKWPTRGTFDFRLSKDFEFQQRMDIQRQADLERDRQLALLTASVHQLIAGQKRLKEALEGFLASEPGDGSNEGPIPTADPQDLFQAAVSDHEFMRTFKEEFDSAERRKQAPKARIRQMDEQRRARYASFW